MAEAGGGWGFGEARRVESEAGRLIEKEWWDPFEGGVVRVGGGDFSKASCPPIILSSRYRLRMSVDRSNRRRFSRRVHPSDVWMWFYC